MFLEKWYADVCDGDRVEILYLANLKLGPTLFGYDGGITLSGRATGTVVPGGVQLPREVDGAVVWPSADPRGVERMRWAGACPREIPLWRHGRQLLTWNPLVLNGPVSGNGLSPSARGYVEKLSLNFSPWRLGLERLMWGRFCGVRHSLVWIEWEGRHPMRLALLDGRECRLREVSLDHVDCAESMLRLTQRRALVREPMSEGALRSLTLPGRLATLQFFRGLESKWFARGELGLGGNDADSGHAVFEEVVWP
jgi:hypothetical protein